MKENYVVARSGELDADDKVTTEYFVNEGIVWAVRFEDAVFYKEDDILHLVAFVEDKRLSSHTAFRSLCWRTMYSSAEEARKSIKGES